MIVPVNNGSHKFRSKKKHFGFILPIQMTKQWLAPKQFNADATTPQLPFKFQHVETLTVHLAQPQIRVLLASTSDLSSAYLTLLPKLCSQTTDRVCALST